MERLNKCLLCNCNIDNPLDFGELIVKDDVAVHYFCLLLSPALYLRSDDEQNGLYGFLHEDIIHEKKRIRNQRCKYCNETQANLSCSVTKCRNSFHLKCGIQNECQYRFRGHYETYCHEHHLKKKEQFNPNQTCGICYEIMGTFSQNHSILSPCCKNAWFHRECLAKFAHTAGYFFKCPLCNDNQKFKKSVAIQGIFIPERDAAWEMEPNAFAEQLERPNECSAKVCKCRNGRKYNAKQGLWEIVYCQACGSKGIHEKCFQGSYLNFYCNICVEIGGGKLIRHCLAPMSDYDKSILLKEYGVRECSVNVSKMFGNIGRMYKQYQWIDLKELSSNLQLASGLNSSTLFIRKLKNSYTNMSSMSGTLNTIIQKDTSVCETLHCTPSGDRFSDSSIISMKQKHETEDCLTTLTEAKKLKKTTSTPTALVNNQSLITNFMIIRSSSNSNESVFENQNESPENAKKIIKTEYKKVGPFSDKRQPLINSFFNSSIN